MVNKLSAEDLINATRLADNMVFSAVLKILFDDAKPETQKRIIKTLTFFADTADRENIALPPGESVEEESTHQQHILATNLLNYFGFAPLKD